MRGPQQRPKGVRHGEAIRAAASPEPSVALARVTGLRPAAVTVRPSVPLEIWEAHKDQISCVTFVADLNVVATSSYDQNVYMWDINTNKKVGSLVLGTGASLAGKTDA